MNNAEQRARDAGLWVVDWDLELDDRFRRQLPSVSAEQAVREYSRDKGMFYSGAARGFFVITSHAMISEALKDWELFSSLGGHFLYLRESPAHRPLPMQMDPPDHTKVRALLAPFFTPQRVQGRFKEEAVMLAREIIERVATLGACDAISELAEPIATAITLNNMGVSPSLAGELTQAVKARSNPSTVGQDKKTYEQGVFTIRDVFLDILSKRRVERADDIPSALLDARIDGQPLADDTILNLCCTAFAAGVHTTSTQMGFAFYYLASQPELRRQIVENPGCIPMVIEEFLRYESSAVMGGRTVTRPTVFHGVQLEAGDRIMLFNLAANRDPAVFENPERIDFNRKPNPHLSLGGGPHRCPGSFQARMIMHTLLEEWHRAIPDYSLGDISDVTFEMAVTGRMSAVPLEFAPRTLQ